MDRCRVIVHGMGGTNITVEHTPWGLHRGLRGQGCMDQNPLFLNLARNTRGVTEPSIPP